MLLLKEPTLAFFGKPYILRAGLAIVEARLASLANLAQMRHCKINLRAGIAIAETYLASSANLAPIRHCH